MPGARASTLHAAVLCILHSHALLTTLDPGARVVSRACVELSQNRAFFESSGREPGQRDARSRETPARGKEHTLPNKREAEEPSVQYFSLFVSIHPLVVACSLSSTRATRRNSFMGIRDTRTYSNTCGKRGCHHRHRRGDVLSRNIVKKGILLRTTERVSQHAPAWPKPNEQPVLQVFEQRGRDRCGPATRHAGRSATVCGKHRCLAIMRGGNAPREGWRLLCSGPGERSRHL